MGMGLMAVSKAEMEMVKKMREMGHENIEGKEIELNELKEIGSRKEIKEPDIEKAKNATLESIMEENKEKAEQIQNEGKDANERDGFRPLTEEEKKDLKEKTGMTDANIEKCTINEDGIIRLKSINEEYVGRIHPETKVPYVEVIVDINGVKIRVVVPKFESIIDVLLPDRLKRAPESEQFKYLNNLLKDEIKTNPELRAQFTETQIAMIERGLKPKGFTWHHNEECGKMQLVRTGDHEGSRHTGGNSIWSGGN